MRPCGMTRITANGYQVTALHRKLIRWEHHGQCVAPTSAIQLFFILVGKTFQMTVHAGHSVGMTHIDSITETIHIHRQATHIAIGNRENLLALDITGLDVQSAMKMPRARLTEVSCQNDIVVYWRNIIDV